MHWCTHTKARNRHTLSGIGMTVWNADQASTISHFTQLAWFSDCCLCTGLWDRAYLLLLSHGIGKLYSSRIQVIYSCFYCCILWLSPAKKELTMQKANPPVFGFFSTSLIFFFFYRTLWKYDRKKLFEEKETCMDFASVKRNLQGWTPNGSPSYTSVI